MGRLEDIIARNQRKGRSREKWMMSLVLGVIVLVLIVLAVCTDLGMPPVPAAPSEGSARGSGTAAERRQIDEVLLRAPKARPQPPPPPPRP